MPVEVIKEVKVEVIKQVPVEVIKQVYVQVPVDRVVYQDRVQFIDKFI